MGYCLFLAVSFGLIKKRVEALGNKSCLSAIREPDIREYRSFKQINKYNNKHTVGGKKIYCCISSLCQCHSPLVNICVYGCGVYYSVYMIPSTDESPRVNGRRIGCAELSFWLLNDAHYLAINPPSVPLSVCSQVKVTEY